MRMISRLIFLLTVLSLSSCVWSDKSTPGFEFMPDMYRSPSYETYSESRFYADSMSARHPVAGTVARGDAIYTAYDRLPYPFPETNEGYEEAGAKLINPLSLTSENLAEGKRLYENFCMVCHGEAGMGDGPVTQRNGPIPPAYSSEQLKNLPEGKMYHTIHYGKNMMGSHASQITPTDRWKIIMHVKTLQQLAAADTTGQKKM